MMRVLEVNDPGTIERIMQEIKVDRYGIKIMVPKAVTHLVRLESLTNIAANILKQEMLSIGADAAIARGSLTGETRKTGCLLMGNLAQFNRLSEKLKKQPFGLNRLGAELSESLTNYGKEKFSLEMGSRRFSLGGRTRIMGVLNLTPDSFSGDGLYPRYSLEHILKIARKMADDGADIIDVGGESTRPGSGSVALKEELARVIPVVRLLAKKIKAPISIDTSKPEVARRALGCGAVMINDITALSDPRMRKACAEYKAAVVLMHMKGSPKNMQENPAYRDVVSEVSSFLNDAVKRAVTSGVKEERIMIDPGIGFGKSIMHNLQILNRLNELKVIGRPVLVGTSRKSFIGKILNAPPQERKPGTISSCILAAQKGAQMVRVHDVKEVRGALDILESVNKA